MDIHSTELPSCRRSATLQTSDGFQLHCRAAIPEGAKAAVILCHGITSDSTESGFFSLIEHRLGRFQFACVRFDFRGHGVSSGSPRDVTLTGQLRDLKTVRSWLDGLLDLPVFYLAASFGASAAIHDAGPRLSSGLVLINPILDYSGVFVRGESEWGAEIVASRIDDAPDIVARIPRSDYVLTRRLAREIESDDTCENLMKIPIPTLIFHGTGDTLVPIGPALRAAETNRLVEVVVYEGGRHGLKEFRADLLGRTQSWLLDHV